MRYKEISGKKFGRLLVHEFYGLSKRKMAIWRCVCDCGNVAFVEGKHLRSGESKSCGCLRKERAAEATRKAKTTHGETSGGNSRTYRAWTNMISRCTNKNLDAYPYYGGRGIVVCDRWRLFENFLEDMGHAPSNLTLERINSNGNYEPSNCRWASKKEQANNRRSNVFIEINGVSKTMSAWCETFGLTVATVHARIKRGWSIDRTFKTPSHLYHSRRGKIS